MSGVGGPQELPEGFKSGFVAFCGRPNAGKSTLMNRLVGSKVAITSNTPQTTRRNVQGVLTLPDAQIVFVDTPGMHKPHDALGEQLNASAKSALTDVDVACMLIDATKPVGTGDAWVAQRVRESDARKVLLITKRDIADPAQVAEQFERAKDMAKWDAVVSLSAKSSYNLDALIEELMQLLPEGPMWFPADMTTNLSLEMMIAELVREKVLRSFTEEVPHSVGVKVDSLEESEGLIRAEVSVYCERDSQKAMLIGAKGQSVKRIGSDARKELERMTGKKAYIGIKVKVKRKWRNDESQIERFGYME
ncbi:MAG: GTPase Era [Eggerthellaceae bacterium]|nr:GTPase Era [Eggerthellaceae bacterium]